MLAHRRPFDEKRIKMKQCLAKDMILLNPCLRLALRERAISSIQTQTGRRAKLPYKAQMPRHQASTVARADSPLWNDYSPDSVRHKIHENSVNPILLNTFWVSKKMKTKALSRRSAEGTTGAASPACTSELIVMHPSSPCGYHSQIDECYIRSHIKRPSKDVSSYLLQ